MINLLPVNGLALRELLMIRNPPDIGIIALAGALASLVFGPEAAVYLGPYVVILLASTVGASFALARRDAGSRAGAIWFFLRTNGLSILLTVAIATAISGYHPALSERVLIAPIAFILGFVGDDWPPLFRWAAGKVNALVDILIKMRGGGNG